MLNEKKKLRSDTVNTALGVNILLQTIMGIVVYLIFTTLEHACFLTVRALELVWEEGCVVVVVVGISDTNHS